MFMPLYFSWKVKLTKRLCKKLYSVFKIDEAGSSKYFPRQLVVYRISHFSSAELNCGESGFVLGSCAVNSCY